MSLLHVINSEHLCIGLGSYRFAVFTRSQMQRLVLGEGEGDVAVWDLQRLLIVVPHSSLPLYSAAVMGSVS